MRIEYSINQRPITRSSDLLPLRPSDFLQPHNTFNSVPSEEPNREMLEGLAASQRKAVVAVWERWKTEYITNLPPVVSNHFKKGDLIVGDLVMINEKNLFRNRLSWPLGRITRVFPSRDELVRSVELQTSNGLLKRAIQCLHKIELSTHDFEDRPTTMSGRVIK